MRRRSTHAPMAARAMCLSALQDTIQGRNHATQQLTPAYASQENTRYCVNTGASAIPTDEQPKPGRSTLYVSRSAKPSVRSRRAEMPDNLERSAFVPGVVPSGLAALYVAPSAILAAVVATRSSALLL